MRRSIAFVPLLLAALSGCFNRQYALDPRDFVRLSAPHATAPVATNGHTADEWAPNDDRAARGWIAGAHAALRTLLPWPAGTALLTDDLRRADGSPRDVYAHFWFVPALRHSMLANLRAYINTIQGSASGFAIDREAPPWPGFERVWVPVRDDMSLYGRLGLALEDGRPRTTTCVIVLPGFFGDTSVVRTRDLSLALRDAGLHVLALEKRGHGQTEARYPDRGYTFGVLESADLLAVDEWLRQNPAVARTGIIGYCWGGNVALLAAWLDGRAADDPDIGPTLRPYFPASAARHFEGGVLAFSPVLHFERVIDETDTWQSPAWRPDLYALQQAVRWRMMLKNWGRPHYSLRRLIDKEFANSELGMNQEIWRDALRFLRLMVSPGLPAGPKLERARVPVLIVHGYDDPFIPSQLIADFVAPIRNPNVAAIVLPGGGHIGFAPFSVRYYYSLIINFFDPARGPRGVPRPCDRPALGDDVRHRAADDATTTASAADRTRRAARLPAD